ncbi:hypothetical protein ACQKFL_23675 [Vreelandella titanicae]|uniref:hypothetical protein n=1 Tax=Vreelandella titanicae TaxID=664683 RepID=UPI003D03672A
MKAHEAVQLVEASALFDAKWYVERYPDVKAANINPAAHYCKYGWQMLRDPSSQFSTAGYLAKHEDIKREGMNPLLHYLRFGKKEGRVISSSNVSAVASKPKVASVPVTPKTPSNAAGVNSDRVSKQLEKTQALLEHYFNRCKELEYSLPDQNTQHALETK